MFIALIEGILIQTDTKLQSQQYVFVNHWCPRLEATIKSKISIFRIKVTLKVTRSLKFEKTSLVEYTFHIWSLYSQKVFFFATDTHKQTDQKLHSLL